MITRSGRDALAFVVRQQLGVRRRIARTTRTLATARGPIEADLYLRASLAAPAAARGTVLVVHGMSPQGHRDPRIEDLCRALAAGGYAVIAPVYDEIRALRIEAASIDGVAATVVAVADDPALCPRGRVAIVTASFSAAMAMLAAARPAVAEHVSAMCLVGGFAEVDSVLRFLMCEPGVDPYGREIVLANFGHLLPPDAPQHDAATCARLLAAIPELRRQLNVVKQLDGLRAPVLLLHGRSDDVIPPSQSALLYERLARHGVASRLVITPFVSHGDAAVSLKLVGDVARLLAGFAFFFRRA